MEKVGLLGSGDGGDSLHLGFETKRSSTGVPSREVVRSSFRPPPPGRRRRRRSPGRPPRRSGSPGPGARPPPARWGPSSSSRDCAFPGCDLWACPCGSRGSRTACSGTWPGSGRKQSWVSRLVGRRQGPFERLSTHPRWSKSRGRRSPARTRLELKMQVGWRRSVQGTPVCHAATQPRRK